MKILIITGMKNSGGTERATLNLCDALKQEEIETVLLSDQGPYVKKVTCLGVKHYVGDIHIKSNVLGTLKTIFKLPKILKSENIQIIHSQMAFPTLLGLLGVILSGRMKKTKILWHSRGLEAQTYKKVCFLFDLFNICALGNCKQEMDKLIKHGMNPKRVNYIYNNFSTSFFEQTNTLLTREKFQINHDEIVIGSVSRLEKGRDVDIFLKICAKLYKNNKNLKFVVCGDGSQKEALKALSKKLNIDKNTVFLGQVTDMYSAYTLMDILINPINPPQGSGAGVGNNIVEAFFSKVLVIANDVIAISEIVKDYETGYLIDVNQEVETVLKIEKILSSFQKNGTVQENAYTFAQNMFSTEKYGEKIKNIYTNMIQNEVINEI